MAVAAHASGTQSATVTTEHSLTTVTVTGVFTFHVDCVNMAAGDIVELRVYQIILTGGTKHVLLFTTFYGAQLTDDTVKMSIPVANELGDASSLEFTLKQTFGTSRNYAWKVLKIAA